MGKTMRSRKKLVAWLALIAMLVSLLPSVVFADGNDQMCIRDRI